MKNLFLTTGIIITIVGAAALVFSALQRYGYYHLLDGDTDMYTGLHRRMILFFVTGIILMVIGISCMILCSSSFEFFSAGGVTANDAEIL